MFSVFYFDCLGLKRIKFYSEIPDWVLGKEVFNYLLLFFFHCFTCLFMVAICRSFVVFHFKSGHFWFCYLVSIDLLRILVDLNCVLRKRLHLGRFDRNKALLFWHITLSF